MFNIPTFAYISEAQHSNPQQNKSHVYCNCNTTTKLLTIYMLSYPFDPFGELCKRKSNRLAQFREYRQVLYFRFEYIRTISLGIAGFAKGPIFAYYRRRRGGERMQPSIHFGLICTAALQSGTPRHLYFEPRFLYRVYAWVTQCDI